MSHHDHKHHHDHEKCGHKHSHGHDHEHTHNHDHGHDHGDGHHSHEHMHVHSHEHGHDHEAHDHHHHGGGPGEIAGHTPGGLSFEEQLKTLFSHWARHNDSHADSYREWAKKARDHKLPETAALLDDVAALTEAVTLKIEEALKTVK